LLGTWPGPGWDPKASTLLQVLVSIQSLILVPDPYFNEPAFGADQLLRGNESFAYNLDIMAQTVQWAMMDQVYYHWITFSMTLFIILATIIILR